MTLSVNGKELQMPEGADVAALVEHLSLGAKRVAVEVNKELVVKQAWATTVLRDGDRVEIVTFVGGG